MAHESLPEEDAYKPGLQVAHIFGFESLVELLQRFAGDSGQKIPTAGECYDFVSIWWQARARESAEHERSVKAAEVAVKEKRESVRIHLQPKNGGINGSHG